jgi:hypothetical protein
MKSETRLALAVTLLASGFALSAQVFGSHEHGDQHQTMIALHTDDFELAETDVSDLAIGESKTIVTESGKTIDLLRTEDGMEIYLDGELLDLEFGSGAELHSDHAGLHKKIEVVCTGADDCEETVWVSESGDEHISAGHDGTKTRVIKREIIIECDTEDDCSERKIFIAEGDAADLDLEATGGDVHVIRLHEDEAGLQDETGQLVIIKKKILKD